jgi:hypothetical protein
MVQLARRVTGSTEFLWHGVRLRYRAPIGERAIELPIAHWFVGTVGAGPVLEIGNVLNHAFPFPHEVVDKYEVSEGVRNVDVVEYQPVRPFPAVLSVSTLEHVGFDETPRSPGKFTEAVQHLYHRCLAPGGRMLVTVPLGYNPEVDSRLFARLPELGRITLYRRRSLRDLWDEVDVQHWPTPATVIPYNYPRHRLTFVAICEVEKPATAPVAT